MVNKEKIREDLGRDIEIIETKKEGKVKFRFRPFAALVLDKENLEKVAKDVGRSYYDSEEMTIQHVTLRDEYL